MQNTGFSWLTDVAEESFKNYDPLVNGGISLAVETSIKNKWNKKYQSTLHVVSILLYLNRLVLCARLRRKMYFFAWLVVKKKDLHPKDFMLKAFDWP